MKITKKLLAVILSALLLVASMPVMAVSAADELTTDDGFKYTVGSDGKATITSYSGAAAELTIPAEIEGAEVVAIGVKALQNNENLTKVVLPESLQVINSYAFYNCKNLADVNFPDSITAINDSAFGDCTSLAVVDLPQSLAALGPYAFGGTPIAEIEIPKSLEKADYSYGGVSYTFNGVEYRFLDGPFALCENLKTVTFEKGVTKIPANLFYGCVGIEEITLPSTITVIDARAFESCLRLKSIELPEAVTAVNSYAFNSCISLKDIDLNSGLTYLGNSAFRNTPVESIEIPRSLDKGDHSYGSISYDLNGVEHHFYDGPFVLCENLKTVTFEKGTNQIAEYLFLGCTGLEEITIPDTVTVIETGAFEACLRLKSIDIPDYVTEIGGNAFYNCASLNDVTFGDSVKTIGANAFSYVPVESVVIPNSVDVGGHGYADTTYEIDGTEYTFEQGPFTMSGLKSATLEDGIKEVPEYLFRGAVNLEEIVIPEGVERIETCAFNGAVRLKNIKLPSTLTAIHNDAFNSCAGFETFVVPATVTAVGNGAFKNCNNLTSIEFKNADTTVGEQALANTLKLTDVKLPANLKVVSEELFSNAKSLQEITIPNTVVSIENFAFYCASSLDEAVIPEGVKEIGTGAFKNCTSLKSVNIPYSADGLGNDAFYGCENLTDVKFEDYSIKTICESTFAECYSLKEIMLPKGLETIEGNAFVNCIELFDVTIPESVQTIENKILSYPGKTTIYSQSGSYVEEYALDNGFKFVDAVTDVETIKFKDGTTKLILEEEKTYKLEFELEPVDANECIKLTSSDDYVVRADGMELTTSWHNDTVEIMAETLSGAVFTFEVYVRGIDYIRFAEDSNHQTKYATGDEFNPDGFKLEAVYSDESVVEIDGYTFSGFDSSKPGDCKVFVNWVDNSGEEYEYYFWVEILGEEPPTFQSQKDDATQIVVEAVTNATLSVVEITEKIKFDEVNLKLSGERVSKFFDITLVEDGEAVQPDGTVTVKIPCDDETAKVYRFEDDGTLTDMEAEFVDGFMVFTTEHFSYYVVTTTEAESEFETGDVNKDGKLSIKDVTAIQKYLAKLVEFDAEAEALADFDNNGKLNIKDATTIQKKLAGLI